MQTIFAAIVSLSMLLGTLVIAPDNVEAAGEDSWITGNVSDGIGPVENAYVKVMRMMGEGEDVNYSFTNSGGDFVIGVVGGLEYMVLVAHGDYYMAMDVVRVGSGETRTVNFTLESISPVVADIVIKGYVLDELGMPVPGGHALGVSIDPMGGEMPYYVNVTSPNATGYFEVRVIPSPAGGGAVAMDYPGYPMAENLTGNPIVSNNTYWFNITLMPKVYNDDALVFGFVTNIDTDEPLKAAVVSIRTSNSFNQMDDGYSNYTLTNESGYYEMNVQNGSGELTISKMGYSMKMFGVDIPSGGSLWQDAQLKKAVAVVRGNVTDLSSGAAIAFARVFLFDNPSDPWSGNITMATTDSTGYYELDAFAGTGLLLGADQDGYSMNITYTNISSDDEIWQDFGLWPTTARIEGMVLDAKTGSPLPWVWIHLYSPIYDEWTNSNETGYYGLDVVPGSYVVEAGGGWYWPYYNTTTATDGNTTIFDIHMMPFVSAILTGKVSDLVTGSPVAGAMVQADSQWFHNTTWTNATGDYEVNLAPGHYDIRVQAMDYYENVSMADLYNLTTTFLDVQLSPRSPPTNTRLHGLVWDPVAGDPVSGATVRVNLPDRTYNNATVSGPGGDYEIYVPSFALEVASWAWAFGVSFTTIDTTGVPDYVLNIDLTADPTPPIVSLAINPAANVSTVNPSAIHIEVQEQFLREMNLFMLMEWNSSGTHSNYSVFQSYGANFDPLNLQNNFPSYSRVGDNHTIDFLWDATTMGGWLTGNNGTVYFPSWHFYSSGQWYDALRGYYTNSNVTQKSGTAFFNGTTGEYLMFRIDEGGLMIEAPDPTGVLEMVGFFAEFAGPSLANLTQQIAGLWDVTGLTFEYQPEVPSGNYKTLFFCRDWGNQGNLRISNMTVDNDPPVADAGSDAYAVVNTTVTLNASMSKDNVGIINYIWEYDDPWLGPVVLTGEVVNNTFNSTGDYEVRLTVVDGAGHYAADITWVNITPDLPPVANAGPNQTVDEDALVQFDGSSSSDDLGITNYTWEIQGLGQYLYGMQPVFTFVSPDVYVVVLVVTDTIGQTSAPDEVQVTVTDITAPTADAGPDQDVDMGTSVVLNGSGSTDNVAIVNYTWTFVDGLPVALYGATQNYVFATPGAYNVTLKISDAVDLSDEDWLEVVVRDTAPPVAAAGNDQTVTVSSTVDLNGSSSSDNVAITSWTWTFVDGTPQTLSGESQPYVFNNLGVFNVTLNVTDAAGNYDRDWVIITVVDDVPPTADAGLDQVVGIGTTVSLNGSGSGDNVGVTSWTWTFMDGVPQTLVGESQSYAFNNLGVFNVTLNVTDAAGNYDLDWIEITVVDNVPPTASAGTDRTVSIGTLVALSGSGSGDNVGVTSWTWTFMDGVPQTLVGESQSYAFDNLGVFNVTLNVTDAAGNYDLDWMQITVVDDVDPVANAGSDRSVSIAVSSSLDASLSSDNVGIVSWTWTFMDVTQQTLTGEVAPYVFNHLGVFNVTLNVTDAAGNYDHDWVTITAVDDVPPTAAAGTDQVVGIGTMVSLNGSASNDNVAIASWVWTFYDGVLITLGNEEAAYVFANLGVFNVTLNVTDTSGNYDLDWVQITVVDDVDPVANAGSDRSVNIAVSSSLDASLSSDNVGIVGWTWTFMDVTQQTLTGEVTPYVFNHLGVFNIMLNVTDAAGNYDIDWVQITVIDNVLPNANAGTDQTVDMGTIVTLSGSGSNDNIGIVNWTWTFNDGGTVSRYGVSASYRFDNPGVFTITLDVADAAGNHDTDTVVVTVEDTVAPVAQASANLVSITTGMTVTFSGTASTDNVAVVNWTWILTDGVPRVFYGSTAQYTFANAGTFVVTLTVADAEGLIDTDSVTIAVVSLNAAPTADAGPDQDVDAGRTVTFDGSDSDDDGGAENLTYTWEFVYEGRTETLTGMSPTFEFEIAGTYEVTLTVTDDGDLSSEDTMTVTVTEPSESFVEQYWWTLAIIGVVIVVIAAVLLMKRKKGSEGAPEPPAPDEPLTAAEDIGPPEGDEL